MTDSVFPQVLNGPIACIGGAHIDVRAHALGPVVPGSSNPVQTRRGFGGVARNVAENLARLGERVHLYGRVGRDSDGDAVIGTMAGLGVETQGIGRSERRPTASYTALLDADGEMVIALADMGIYEELSPAALESVPARAADCPVWFVDANLPQPSLRFLAEAAPRETFLVLDTVSVAKAYRVRDILGRVDLLFANADEAAALAGREVRHPLDACETCAALHRQGASRVVMGRGGDGVCVGDATSERFLPAATAEVEDVTGAGDALVAGTLHGLMAGRSLVDAAAWGLALAAITCESEHAVALGLTHAAVAERAGLAAEMAPA